MSSYQGFRLETERLRLRVLDESYAAPVLDYYVRNRTFLEPWEPTRPEGFYTLIYHQEHLRAELVRMNADSLFKLWIFKKEASVRPIGVVVLNNIVRGCFLSAHLGYKLDRDEVRQGYMTEAVRAVISFAFNTLHLHRIEANIIPSNYASLSVVNRLGFYHEGLAEKYLKINGEWRDHIHMVLRNEALEAADSK